MGNRLPVDFEERVRAANANIAKGYPYRLSARDLMLNFDFLDFDIDDDDNSSNLTFSIEYVPTSKGALRKRLVIASTNDYDSTHPWKVTPNGDNTVTVSPGSILSYDDVSSYASLQEFIYHEGGDITGITDDGYIYGVTDWAFSLNPIASATITDSNSDTSTVTLLRLTPVFGGSVGVFFGTSLPASSNSFVFEIAKVTINESTVSVEKQVLTHNPTLWSFDFPP